MWCYQATAYCRKIILILVELRLIFSVFVLCLEAKRRDTVVSYEITCCLFASALVFARIVDL